MRHPLEAGVPTTVDSTCKLLALPAPAPLGRPGASQAIPGALRRKGNPAPWPFPLSHTFVSGFCVVSSSLEDWWSLEPSYQLLLGVPWGLCGALAGHPDLCETMLCPIVPPPLSPYSSAHSGDFVVR